MSVTIELDLKEILTKLNEDLNYRLDKLDHKIDKVNEDLNHKIDKVNEDLNHKIDKLDQKIDKVSEEVTKLQVSVAHLSGDVKIVDEKVNELGKRLDQNEFINRSVIVGVILVLIVELLNFFTLVFLLIRK